MESNFGNIVIAALVVLFLFISLAMVLVVLIQRPQGGGLSGAFGAGGGSGQSAFGARTGDALTISTIVIFLLFLGVAIGLNFALRPGDPTLPVLQAGDGAAQTEGAGETTDADPAADPLPASADAPAPADEPATDGDGQ